MSNVSMPGVVGAAASGASITKPFIFIIMLSRVSENIWLSVSMAAPRADVGIPMAPSHKTSPVPMAMGTDVIVPMRGVPLNVYPADSNMSRISDQSFCGVATCCGGGALNNCGVTAIFSRGGCVNICSGIVDAFCGCAGAGVTLGAGTSAGHGCAGCCGDGIVV